MRFPEIKPEKGVRLEGNDAVSFSKSCLLDDFQDGGGTATFYRLADVQHG